MQTITIEVDERSALAYKAASAEQRRKLALLFALKLNEVMLPQQSLEDVMRDMRQKAQERGLTPEILDQLH